MDSWDYEDLDEREDHVLDEAACYDSLEHIVRHEDLQKFVLFKTHYRKYMDLADSFEDLAVRLEAVERQLQLSMAAESAASESLAEALASLRAKEAILQAKEDELFAADERIADLECELEEDRRAEDDKSRQQTGNKGRGPHQQLKQQAGKERTADSKLENECRQLRLERGELQLRCQVLKAQMKEESEALRRDNRRLARSLDLAGQREQQWRSQWEQLRKQVWQLECEWQENRALQNLMREGLRHLARCDGGHQRRRHCLAMKPSESAADIIPAAPKNPASKRNNPPFPRGAACKLCARVRASYRSDDVVAHESEGINGRRKMAAASGLLLLGRGKSAVGWSDLLLLTGSSSNQGHQRDRGSDKMAANGGTAEGGEDRGDGSKMASGRNPVDVLTLDSVCHEHESTLERRRDTSAVRGKQQWYGTWTAKMGSRLGIKTRIPRSRSEDPPDQRLLLGPPSPDVTGDQTTSRDGRRVSKRQHADGSSGAGSGVRSSLLARMRASKSLDDDGSRRRKERVVGNDKDGDERWGAAGDGTAFGRKPKHRFDLFKQTSFSLKKMRASSADSGVECREEKSRWRHFSARASRAPAAADADVQRHRACCRLTRSFGDWDTRDDGASESGNPGNRSGLFARYRAKRRSAGAGARTKVKTYLNKNNGTPPPPSWSSSSSRPLFRRDTPTRRFGSQCRPPSVDATLFLMGGVVRCPLETEESTDDVDGSDDDEDGAGARRRCGRPAPVGNFFADEDGIYDVCCHGGDDDDDDGCAARTSSPAGIVYSDVGRTIKRRLTANNAACYSGVNSESDIKHAPATTDRRDEDHVVHCRHSHRKSASNAVPHLEKGGSSGGDRDDSKTTLSDAVPNRTPHRPSSFSPSYSLRKFLSRLVGFRFWRLTLSVSGALEPPPHHPRS